MGRFTFTTHGVRQGSELRHRTSRWLFPALQGKEWYRTRGFKEVALVHGVVEDSYRKTSRWINRMRHQTEEEGTPSRTLCDGSESEGTHILAHVEARTEQILSHYGVTDPGLPTEERDTASASTTLSSEAIQTAVEACQRVEEETAANGQSQSRAFLLRAPLTLHLMKLLKDIRQILGRDAYAGISYRYLHLIR